MFKIIFCIYGFVLLIPNLYSQSIVTLNQPEYGYQEHCASLKVDFQVGYSYTPTGLESMHAYISPSCGNHVQLKSKLDGGYYNAYTKYIRFQYNEEYEVGEFRILAYNIYDKTHTLVGGVDLDGNSLVSGSLILQNEIGENKYVLNFGALSLTINEYYTLEVFNDKHEKKVLKFKVYN